MSHFHFEQFFSEARLGFEMPALTFRSGKLHLCTPMEFRPGLDPVVERTSVGVVVKVLGYVCLEFLRSMLLRLLGTTSVHMIIKGNGELLFI